MKNLAIYLRFLYLYTQIAHHSVKGSIFFSDHEFLGDLYETLEGFYDDIIERSIGLNLDLNLYEINIEAANLLNKYVSSPTGNNSSYFSNILNEVAVIQDIIKEVNSTASLGTQNLIQGMADSLEKEVGYKIGQRLKK